MSDKRRPYEITSERDGHGTGGTLEGLVGAAETHAKAVRT